MGAARGKPSSTYEREHLKLKQHLKVRTRESQG